jgi:hypothetical protein
MSILGKDRARTGTILSQNRPDIGPMYGQIAPESLQSLPILYSLPFVTQPAPGDGNRSRNSMSKGNPFDFNDADDDRPRRRRSRDDEDDDQMSNRRKRYRDSAEEDYADDFGRRRKTGDGLGQAAMITGIISLCLTLISALIGCLCFLGVFGVGLGVIGGIVAIILGFVARSRTPGSTTGLAGILTGFVNLVIGLLMVILVIVGVGFLALNAPPPKAGPGGGNPNINNPRKF